MRRTYDFGRHHSSDHIREFSAALSLAWQTKFSDQHPIDAESSFET
jgi:hypothetical protein